MEPDLAKTVEEVRRTAEAVGCKISLVGALVFEFSPEFPDSLRFRRTNDADFAVFVRDWAAFAVLKDALLKSEFKNDNKTEHRLHRGTTQIDLIPYGPKVAPAGKLTWPESRPPDIGPPNLSAFRLKCPPPRYSVAGAWSPGTRRRRR